MMEKNRNSTNTCMVFKILKMKNKSKTANHKFPLRGIEGASFVHQQDQSDCGVACLLSVIQYYGGYNSLENLRKLSGTTVTGTTLLGLYQAANAVGFHAEGCEADMAALIQHTEPCILHVVIDKQLQHYVVYFGIAPLSAGRGAGGEAELLFITHRLHVLKNFCDRIYIIENGIISSCGTHHELLQEENLYSSYWRDLAPGS
jgi:ABC-type bacteriocin/lantibiotic exporter with double-glycine peptidase domain